MRCPHPTARRRLQEKSRGTWRARPTLPAIGHREWPRASVAIRAPARSHECSAASGRGGSEALLAPITQHRCSEHRRHGPYADEMHALAAEYPEPADGRGRPAMRTACSCRPPRRPGLAKPAQLRIPAAKRLPKSGCPCFQFCSAGWQSPATISVAPALSLAKHRIWAGSSMFRATGLCVAIST